MNEMYDFFDKRIIEKFEMFCHNNKIDKTFEHFIYYLRRYNILKSKTIKQYCVLDMYPFELHESNGRKTQAVQAIEEKTGYCQASIYNILKNNQNDFKINKDIPNLKIRKKQVEF